MAPHDLPRRLGARREPLDDERVFQLKFTLQGIRPPVWRRVLVHEHTTLAVLHEVVQAAMGWESYHLWRFESGGLEYGPQLDVDWDDGDTEDAAAFRLGDLVDRGDVLLYEYDFGDAWEHRIRVEKVLPAEPGRTYPVCIAAERACPPEDVGGVWGYAEFLEAIADPHHPEHASMLEWVGGEFDPEAVDRDEIDRRLAALPDDVDPDEDEPEEAVPFIPNAAEAMMHEIRSRAEEMLSTLLEENPDASLNDLNAALGELVVELNTSVQPDLGGLSPVQVRRLIDADWDAPDSAVRLDGSLPLAELEGSRMLHNARLFLGTLAEQGEVRATQKGNLPRAFVHSMRERMRWPPAHRDWLEERSVVNEEDVFSLHLLRVVLDLGGLIKRRTGKFSLTRAGERLLDEARAGELFATLFRTYFRKFNLAYVDGVGPVPGFQPTVAVTLYRFGQVGTEWASPEELGERTLLPAVIDEVPVDPHFSRLPIVMESRLLRPLEGFALAETRLLPEEPGQWHRQSEYRKAPLFDRFLRFDLGTGGS